MPTTIANVHFRINCPLYRRLGQHLGFHNQDDKDAFKRACIELLGAAGWTRATNGYFYHAEFIGYLYPHPDDLSGYFDAAALEPLAALIESLPKVGEAGAVLQYRSTDRYDDTLLHSATEITAAFHALCPAARDEALVAAMTTTRRSGFSFEAGYRAIAGLLRASSGAMDGKSQHIALNDGLMTERRALMPLVESALSQLVKQRVVKALSYGPDAVIYRRMVRAGAKDWVSPRRKDAA